MLAGLRTIILGTFLVLRVVVVALFAAVLLLVVRSRFAQDVLVRARDDGRCGIVRADAAGVEFLRVDGWPHEQAPAWRSGRRSDFYLVRFHGSGPPPVLGERLLRGTAEVLTPVGAQPGELFAPGPAAPAAVYSASTNDGVLLRLPYATLLAVLGPWPLIWVLRRGVGTLRGRGRGRRGLCARCGYDVRASVGRCPECGSALPAVAPDGG